MKAGLEVHQQLSTGKLFCRCPCELSETVTGSFSRRLAAAGGEDRSVDPAARFQASRDLLYRYETVPSTCLVEMDEEPPRPLDRMALESALIVARLLHARVVDEIEVMRKIVVDGSNTSGFQRTALVAVGGHLEVGGRRISIESICLEEDAARKIAEAPGEVTFRLDRLGIPLLEIATGPDITNGAEARAVAEAIGALLRATDRVRRGIGSVREDVNVSTEGGRRIEIKGVQELRLIETYVQREVERQEVLLAIRERLKSRGAQAPSAEASIDLTELLRSVASGPLAPKGSAPRIVLGLPLPGYAGLLRSPEGSEERLGRELADRARAVGLRGLLHSDELPGYGVSEEEVARVRSELHLGAEDGFVLVADLSRPRVEAALRSVAERAALALEGIPGETRDPLPDGRTRYSRPLPGRHRMYPETDVPPIVVSAAELARIETILPEQLAALRERLARSYRIPPDVAQQLVDGGESVRFETLAHRGRSPAAVARLLIQDLPAAEAAASASLQGLSLETLDEVLRASESGAFAKEGIPAVLTALGQGARTVTDAASRAGLTGLSDEALDGIISAVVAANADLLRAKSQDAFQPLMGDVMKQVRGRRDGQEIARRLREAIARARPAGAA